MDLWSIIISCQICNVYFLVTIFHYSKKKRFFSLVFGSTILLVLPIIHLNHCLPLVKAYSVSQRMILSLLRGMGVALVTAPWSQGWNCAHGAGTLHRALHNFPPVNTVLWAPVMFMLMVLMLAGMCLLSIIYSGLPLINEPLGKPGIIIMGLKKLDIKSLAP